MFESALNTLTLAISFVDNHEGFFMVIFTACLALFTWRLYRATAGLVDADRPQLLPENLKMPGIRNVDDAVVKFSLDYRIKNFGRSPAVLKRLTLQIHVGFELPRRPNFKNFAEIHLIVPPTLGLGPARETIVTLPIELRRSILEQQIRLFVYGRVEYSGISGRPHTTNFGCCPYLWPRVLI